MKYRIREVERADGTVVFYPQENLRCWPPLWSNMNGSYDRLEYAVAYVDGVRVRKVTIHNFKEGGSDE